MRFSIRFIGSAAFACATLLAACSGSGGGTHTLPPQQPGTLQVSVTVPTSSTSSAARRAATVGGKAQSAYVYIYPAGKFRTPPPNSLAGVVDLTASSKNCAVTSTGRLCQATLNEPSTGAMVVHTDFYSEAPSTTPPVDKKLASTHSKRTLTGSDAYPVITEGTVASLSMDVSEQYFSGPGDFDVTLEPLDSAGNVIAMTSDVAVYAPSGAITAAAAPQGTVPPIISDGVVSDTSGGAAEFHYTGAQLLNPVTVVGIAGTFSQTAQILPYDPSAPRTSPLAYPAGSPLTFGETDVFGGTDTESYKVGFSVGSSATHDAQIDTGSELFIVNPADVAGAGTDELLGPGEPGYENLTSDGFPYAGHYYLARVTLHDTDGTIVGKTVPMKIMVEDVSCPNDKCYNLMGVGFGRPTSTPDPKYGATIKAPVMNTLLQQEKVVTGTDLAAGYELTKDKLFAGLAQSDTAGFAASNFQLLAPFAGRPGDWNSPMACVQLDDGSCIAATTLVDVGIRYMILNDFGTSQSDKIAVHFLSGSGQSGASDAYSFSFKPKYGVPPNGPDVWATPPAPAYVDLRNNSASPDVNTGIQPLKDMDYLYDNANGRAGYESNAP